MDLYNSTCFSWKIILFGTSFSWSSFNKFSYCWENSSISNFSIPWDLNSDIFTLSNNCCNFSTARFLHPDKVSSIFISTLFSSRNTFNTGIISFWNKFVICVSISSIIFIPSVWIFFINCSVSIIAESISVKSVPHNGHLFLSNFPDSAAL